ncbi:MAG: DNA polymerase I [Coriobacteriales bacterium]|nr:DNA polymerase I [Coriobacteriales bacterium]
MTQDRKILAVIDGNSLLHRAFHAVAPNIRAKDGTPTNAVYGFLQMFIKMVKDFNPDAIVCAWDTHRPKWRMKALPKYKAQRPPLDPDLAVQFPIIERILESLNVRCIKMEGYEGDDILGSVAAQTKDLNFHTYLITGDKDCYQLVNDSTSVIATKKGMSDIVIYDRDKVFEKMGVFPEQVPDFLGLKGDSVDNIPGVPKVGDKTAAKLLQEYGSVENLLEHAGEVKGAVGKSLQENKEEALVSKLVATIKCDAPIELDYTQLQFPNYDSQTVRASFMSIGFKRHLHDILNFIGENFDDVMATASDELDCGTSSSSDSSFCTACENGIGGANYITADFDAMCYRCANILKNHEFETTNSVKTLLDVAISENAPISISIDKQSQANIFDSGHKVLFSDGHIIGVSSIEESLSFIKQILQKGTLVSIHLKQDLNEILSEASDEDRLGIMKLISNENIFDCSLANYVLNSEDTNFDAQKLVQKYFEINIDELNKIPSDAEFSVISAHLLHEILSLKIVELDKDNIFKNIELLLLPVLLQMQLCGVYVDCNCLNLQSFEFDKEIHALKEKIIELAGQDFNIDSPLQLSEILFDKLGLDKSKSKKTTRAYSTDKSVLESLYDDHEIIPLLLRYRTVAKLKSTYVDVLPSLVSRRDERVHTTFHQNVVATGRLSSSDPNLQNIPVRTDDGARIRQAFCVPRGKVFVSADYSQIELRLLAHLSGDRALIEAFNSGADLHRATASQIFGLNFDDVTPEHRSRAKAVNFGIVYGQGSFGLAKSLRISNAEAKDIIDSYFATFSRVKEYLDETIEFAIKNGFAVTMFGRRRYIPDITSKNKRLAAFSQRVAMNHPMQGSAADIIKLAMIDVQDKMNKNSLNAKLVLQVHDELDFEVEKTDAEKLCKIIKESMENVAKLSVPLVVDIGCANNWEEAH